jgi:ABC-2 type transport system permease protein
MFKVLALLRVGALTALSYRISALLSLGSLVAMVIPIYFVANALQPVMEGAIQTEGGQYFAFVIVGMMSMWFIGYATDSIPGVVGGGIATGTLEAMMGTPTRLPTLLAGLMSYNLFWLGVKSVVLLAAGAMFGAEFVWGRMLIGMGIIGLIVLAYLPVGLVAAALVLAFRTSGPLTRWVTMVSVLLGGVYYPTHVIPSWIEQISAFIPLTYGLRALRRTILEGLSLTQVLPDLAILAGFAVVLFAAGCAAFMTAFGYARRAGSLSHY